FIDPNKEEMYKNGSGKCEAHFHIYKSSKLKLSGKVNSFREGNNFSYSLGNVKFDKCDNSVVISDYKSVKLRGITNRLIIIREGNINFQPISNLEKNLEYAQENLKGKTIQYSLPSSVFVRESLTEKDLEKLVNEIKYKFSLTTAEIKPLSGGRAKFGVYYLKTDSNREYVLKYQGQDILKVEVLAKISNNYPEMFSKFIPRSDNGKFSLELKDGLYGLEEYLRGTVIRERNPNFFRYMGNFIQHLHYNLGEFLLYNPLLKEPLITESRHLSESNLLAISLDLINSHRNHSFALKVIQDLIRENVSERIQSLPETIIHGDLNTSNLIWNKNVPKIIDKETIKISKRIMELQIPLLFIGTTRFPEYSKGSLKYLSQGLASSGNKLSEKESKLIKSLLKYSLIKNYVVRNIRRALNQSERLDSLNENLRVIENEE
ncbi:MAG: phosphotransferase, partial [Candidatus Pacearchaeota archaeon]